MCLCAAVTFPEQSSELRKDDNLYFKALSASVVEMEKEWGRFADDNGGTGIRTDYHHMVVEKDLGISDELPEQVDDYHFEYLDDSQQIARFKRLKKKFPVLKVGAASTDGPELKVVVSVYWVSVKNRRMIEEFSDWSEVRFRLDSDKQAFVVSSVKLGGI